MANNVLAAQVNLSIMEGVKSSYSVDVRDCFGESVDLSTVLLKCTVIKQGVGESVDADVQWSESLMAHVLTFPELPEGRHIYEVRQQLDTGEVVPLVQGVIGAFKSFSGGQGGADSVLAPNRTLRLFASTSKQRLEAQWKATAAAEGFAYKAKEYAALLETLLPFVDSFNEALKSCITVENDYLYICGEKVMPPVYLKGKDAPTPCIRNGYWFLKTEEGSYIDLNIKATGEDGLTPEIGSDGYWYLGDRNTGVKAAGKDGLDGWMLRRVIIPSINELPKGKVRGVYYYVGTSAPYQVYTWLEDPSDENIGQWVNLGEGTEIASQDVFGLVQLGTDVTVTGGAPVGFNADQELSVPLASSGVAGSSKLSTATTMSEDAYDGCIGLNDNGQLMARHATTSTAGVVKISRSDRYAKVLAIGLTPDDLMVDGTRRPSQLGVTRAESNTYGVSKVAAVLSSDDCNEVVWNTPIFLRSDATSEDPNYTDDWYTGANGMLFFPLYKNGALRWDSSRQTSKDGKNWSTEGCLRFYHSESFSTGDAGLELVEATSGVLGGVYVTLSMEDDRASAVPSVDAVVSYLAENFYIKGETYSKTEVDAAISEAVDNVSGFASEQYVAAYTYPREVIDKKIGCTSGKLDNVEVLTPSEKEEMTSFDSKTLYFVIPE